MTYNFALSLANEDIVYDDGHAHGVISLAVASLLSGMAVLCVFLAMMLSPSALSRTHIMPYFVSLLAANVLQAVGGAFNLRWVIDRAVEPGAICSIQGAVKQAGNVGTAVWSFVLSICVFNLMFLRSPPSATVSYVLFGVGWCFVAIIVAIGPLAIESSARGPYFGPSGYWCWITDAYPAERTFLEYFFEFLSAGVSFFLYVAILLRVRGNLVRASDGWHLRFVPNSERWQLAIRRDWIDSSMMGVAVVLIWYPVAYSILLFPVATVRFVEFGGSTIPFAVTILADTLFNLQGLLNATLLFGTRKFIPTAPAILEGGVAPRKILNMSSSEAIGITPFVLPKLRPAGIIRTRSSSQRGRPITLDALLPLTRSGSNASSLVSASVNSRTALYHYEMETP